VRNAEIVNSTILLLISALVIYEAKRLGFGWGLEGPQSGFFIFWLGLGLGGCSLITLFHNLAGAARSSEPFVHHEGLVSVLKVLLPAAALVAALPWIGFYLGSPLYIGLYMRWIGRFGWKSVVLASLLIPTVIFLVFEKWLLVLLPKGILENVLVF